MTGTGQTMLTALFLVLLTVLMIASNQLLIDSTQNTLESLAAEQGLDLAHQLMMEILSKNFDANYTPPYTYYVTNVSNFTTPSGQKPSTGHNFTLPDVTPYKSTSTYTSVGEYNGYKRTANGANLTGFQLTVSVYYVSRTNATTASASQTYYKRIDVSVTHPTYLTTARTLSRIVNY